MKRNLNDKRRKDNLMEIDSTNPEISKVADIELLGFLRIILKINKNREIIQYRSNPEILSRISKFTLKMGF